MSYLVTLTLDLSDAESEDYKCITDQLAELKLENRLKGNNGEYTRLPFNTYAREIEGDDSKKIADGLARRLEDIFEECDVEGKILITVGDSWSWRVRNLS